MANKNFMHKMICTLSSVPFLIHTLEVCQPLEHTLTPSKSSIIFRNLNVSALHAYSPLPCPLSLSFLSEKEVKNAILVENVM